MNTISEYRVGELETSYFQIRITEQDLIPGSNALDGFGFSLKHEPTGHAISAGTFDMMEDLYKRILEYMSNFTEHGIYLLD